MKFLFTALYFIKFHNKKINQSVSERFTRVHVHVITCVISAELAILTALVVPCTIKQRKMYQVASTKRNLLELARVVRVEVVRFPLQYSRLFEFIFSEQRPPTAPKKL